MPRLLALFLFAFLLRAVLNLYFFLTYGWFSSNLIEIWFYYGVARGVFPLSPLDPTRWILRLTALLVPSGALYTATAFAGALVSATGVVLVYLWIRRAVSEKAGLIAALITAVLPSSLTLCLANFSHDLVQLPMVILFWLALAAAERSAAGRERWILGAAAAFVALIGLAVGPLMAAALIGALFYLDWLVFRAARSGRPTALATAVFAASLLLATAVLYLLMRDHLLDLIAPLAEKARGIDLRAQVEITVGDLQPLPPDSLWNRYTLFLFFIPWGLWTAYRRREFFLLSLFLFGMALSLAVNRGTRLLDPIVAALIALGWANWSRNGLKATAATMLLLLVPNLFPASLGALARGLRLEIPLVKLLPLFSDTGALFGGPFLARQRVVIGLMILFFLALAAAGTLALSSRRRFFFPAFFALVAAAEAGWVLLSASLPSSEQLEYDSYRALDERAQPGEKIFAAWNQGFFIPAVTRLAPITTPDRIDIGLTSFYWAEEKEAYDELKRRGVKYVHINNRYFGLTAVDPARDAFSLRGNTIIGSRPDHIRTLSRMRRTFLYRLNYEPETLTLFRTIYDAFDPQRQIGVRIFALN
jgi:hypothetical protein